MLEQELLKAIVDICDIQDEITDDFPLEDPLLGPDSYWGLDSLDAIEIVVMIQEVYGIRIQGQDQAREILSTLKTLADFIRSKQKESVA